MLQESAQEVSFWIDDRKVRAASGTQLLKAVLTVTEIPHICYHSDLMGPIRSCDTCLVEVNGELVRSCAEQVKQGAQVRALSERAKAARAAAYDRSVGWVPRPTKNRHVSALHCANGVPIPGKADRQVATKGAFCSNSESRGLALSEINACQVFRRLLACIASEVAAEDT